ncbi:hypothetical protein, partial [Sporosarcina luteola]|uniref:hypothetical protein n=1 Tax=Sporosarcina luteola TaxID=582850 RepID=UPI001C3FE0F3
RETGRLERRIDFLERETKSRNRGDEKRTVWQLSALFLCFDEIHTMNINGSDLLQDWNGKRPSEVEIRVPLL